MSKTLNVILVAIVVPLLISVAGMTLDYNHKIISNEQFYTNESGDVELNFTSLGGVYSFSIREDGNYSLHSILNGKTLNPAERSYSTVVGVNTLAIYSQPNTLLIISISSNGLNTSIYYTELAFTAILIAGLMLLNKRKREK